MNREIRDRWVAALRSGEYGQGKGVLRRKAEQSFCCLGVLCDLAAEEGVGSWSEGGNVLTFLDTRPTPTSKRVGGNCINLVGLTDRVQEWSGIGNELGMFHEDFEAGQVRLANGYTAASLAQANDQGAPFSEIADLIESHF